MERDSFDGVVDLKHYLRVLIYRRWVVAAAILFTVGGTIGISLASEPGEAIKVHHVTAIYSAIPVDGDDLGVDERIRLAQHLAQTYKFAFGTPAILDVLRDRLGVDASAYPGYPKISVSVPSGTSLINVLVTHRDRYSALAIANGFPEAVTGGSDLGSLDLQGARGGLELFAPAQIVPPSNASVPTSHVPLAPRQRAVNLGVIVVSAIGGLIVGALAAVGLEAIGGKARWPDQVVAATGLRAVGRLQKSSHSSKATALIGPGDEAVIEKFRATKTQLQAMPIGKSGCRSLLVTSPGRGEGKTSVVANLAETLAENGATVVVISSDLRSPTSVEDGWGQQHPGPGLSDFLSDPTLSIGDILRPTALPTVQLVARGGSRHEAIRALDSQRMDDLLSQLRAMADWILLDSPSALAVADAARLAAHADGTLLVVDAAKTKLSSARAAAVQLQQAGANILGFFHNRSLDERTGRPVYHAV